jgi:hypothetical protein
VELHAGLSAARRLAEVIVSVPSAGPIREVTNIDPGALPDSLLDSTEPLVVRGLAANWPMVRAAGESNTAACGYLLRHYKGMPVSVLSTPPQARGRFFYNEDFTGFNFKRAKGPLDVVLGDLARAAQHPNPPALYVGSTAIKELLPGFREENDFAFGARDPYASIWLGNRTCVVPHYDLPTNLACVVAGRRRFTLFPPDQLRNLYVGPLEFNPAGQAVSLVDLANPDFERFPRFAEALNHARVAELSAGDAVLIPSLWWHQIEALDAFNVLVNYWWQRSSLPMEPFSALLLTLMTVRDLPPEQRTAWQEIFRHYVFEADAQTAAHIPEHARGALGVLDEDSLRAVRAALLARLNGAK